MSNEEIAKIRDALAEADHALVQALDDRAAAVKRFVKLREEQPELYGALPSTPEVIEAALARSQEFPRAPLERVLREVLGACAEMVAPVEVAVVGPEGAFGWVVGRRWFGSSATLRARPSVSAVFDDVERRRLAFGVVPLETSTEGALTETLESLVRGDARIAGEVTVPCSYDLVSATGNASDIEKVLGTAQALAACEHTLAAQLPRATRLEVQSGNVAEELAREDHGAAALVTAWTEDDARGLRRVSERVEDRAGVETRFVIVSHERPARTGKDRTLLALGVGDEPGSLHQALRPFAERGINLTRIESRPSRATSWRYLFILELDGHVTDRSVLTAIDEVRSASQHLKILGSFPRPS